MKEGGLPVVVAAKFPRFFPHSSSSNESEPVCTQISHLFTTTLPCAKNGACFWIPPCPRCPESDTTPRNTFYIWAKLFCLGVAGPGRSVLYKQSNRWVCFLIVIELTIQHFAKNLHVSTGTGTKRKNDWSRNWRQIFPSFDTKAAELKPALLLSTKYVGA